MTIRISAQEILDLWEAGQGRFPFQRAVLVLEQCGWTDAADLSLAERDRALMAVYRATFQPAFELITDCPTCDMRLELTLDTADLDQMLHVPPPALPAALKGIQVRDVTTRDLEAVAREQEPAQALQARLTGSQTLPASKGDTLAGWIDTRLSEAEINLNLTCVACGQKWQETLDIPEFTWFEIEKRAHGTLRDVAELARSFSWSEAAILGLGPIRRQAYLNLARAS